EDLLDEDARADYAGVEELAGDALRRRDYGRALALWDELRERLVGGPRGASSVRSELARRADVQSAEARALDGLLERVAEHLRALDGRSIELRWGSIVYPAVRIQVGADPRREGFRADTIAGVLQLGELPSAQLETFAALPSEAELAPEERLTLASFRLHEGRPQDAQRVLLSGPWPESEPWNEVSADLAARIASALERSEQRADVR